MPTERNEVIEGIASRRAAEINGDTARGAQHPEDSYLDRIEADLDAVGSLARQSRELLETAVGVVGQRNEVVDVKAKLRDEVLPALYEGDMERSADALAEVIESGRTGQPTVKQLASEVRHELEKKAAMDDFARKYPEVISDEAMAGIADRHYELALREGKSEQQALEHAGRCAREELRSLAEGLGFAPKVEAGNATDIIGEMQRARRPARQR